jgi:archaeal flagellar protein FlaJ
MRLKKMNWLGIILGGIVLIIDFIFFFNTDDKNLFYFISGIGVVVISLPFVVQLVLENKRDQEINEMFLEFSRNLSENVASGTPISKSIINLRKAQYGALTPHVIKLANQIEVGIPVEQAFRTFSYEINNKIISRAVALIEEAQKAGGEIEHILDSTAISISEIEKLKKERKAAIYNLVVQGYIIFFIFIGIMMVMEFKILPQVTGIGSFGDFSATSLRDVENLSIDNNALDAQKLSRPFLFLLLAQGFFAGLTIGKLTEGSIKFGLKHSFVMVVAAFLISTGTRLFLT